MSQKIKITITFIYIAHIVATVASECGTPDSIENGTFFITIDGKVKYTCNPGYYMAGRAIQHCTNGGWQGPAPQCKPRPCGNPGEILNGYYEAPTATFGSTATFFCEHGYRLVGNPDRICEASGWSGQVPTCEVVTCEDLESIENGRTPTAYNKESWEHGMVAKFSCIGDYTLIGAEELVCTETGRWDKAPPICKAVQCNRPEVPEGALIVAGFGPTYKYRETITYRCQYGYEMIGDNIIECAENNDFLPSPPSCNLTGCKHPGVIAHGRTEKERETYALYEEIMYWCNYGYNLKGSSIIQCKKNNMFVPEPPVCEEIICEAPRYIENGRKISDPRYKTHYKYGEKITYKCNTGFKPLHQKTSVCNENGIFMPPIPTCQIVTCEASYIDNGKITPSKSTYHYQESITVSCNHGFKLSGETRSVCKMSGNFEPRIPTCRRIICVAPYYIANGKRTTQESTYYYGDIAIFRCFTGFEPFEETSVTCSTDGKFEPPIPTCRRVTCEAPHIDNGKITPSKSTYHYQESITVSCNHGFKLFGETTSVCQMNGNFVPRIPTCQRENPTSLLNETLSLLCHIIATKTNSIETERNLLRLEEESLKNYKKLQQKVETILKHWKILNL